MLIADLSQKIVLKAKSFSGLLAFLESLHLAADKLNAWAAEQSRTTRKNAWIIDKNVFLSQVRIVAERFHGINRDADQFLPWLKLAATMEATPGGKNATLSLLQHLLVPEIGLRELASLPTVLEATVLRHTESTAGDPESRSQGPSLQQDELVSLIREGSQAAASLLERLTMIREQCEAAAFKMDFRFLYNSRRKLFSIGYNVDIGKLDRGHYDLLCSECRIASSDPVLLTRLVLNGGRLQVDRPSRRHFIEVHPGSATGGQQASGRNQDQRNRTHHR